MRSLVAGISYQALHLRLRRQLGPARQYVCTFCCEARADEWALILDEHDEDIVPGRDGPFSEDLTRYEPLCRSCHRVYDRLEDEQ